MSGNLPPGLVVQQGQVIFPFSSCAICVIENRILLVRQVRAASAPGATYELPGGGMMEGESAIEVALRELREETGVVAETGSLVLTLDMDLDKSVQQTSLVEVSDHVVNTGLVPELTVEWIELEVAYEMTLRGAISHAPTVVAVLLQVLKRARRR